MHVFMYDGLPGPLKLQCAMTLPKLTSVLDKATSVIYGTVLLNSGATQADAADPTRVLTAEALGSLLDETNNNALTDAIDRLIARKVTCDFVKALDMSCVPICT